MWLQAPQSQMPFCLLQSPVSFFYELQRVRYVTTVAGQHQLLVASIEGEPFRAKAIGLCLGAACKLTFSSERPGKTASAKSGTKDGIEAFVSVPSLFQAYPSIDTISHFFLVLGP